MTNLETTMDRGVLLAALREKLTELRKEVKRAEAPHTRAMKKHVAHVARVLAQASKDVASGKLKPDHGRWCHAQSVVQERIGEVPRGTEEIEKHIRAYEAAIYQVEHSRGEKMRVTTDQVERWLGGNTLHRSR